MSGAAPGKIELARHAIAKPAIVVVQRARGAEPQVIADAVAIVIHGGERFAPRASEKWKPGDPLGKSFTVGYRGPARVDVVMRSGKRATLPGCFQLLICGGIEGGADLLGAIDKVAARPAAVEPMAFASEIPDRKPTDVIDSGAALQIVDRIGYSGPDYFDQQVAARHKAMQEAGGDDFVALANLQHGEHAELQATAPFQQTVAPPSVTRGILGSQGTAQSPSQVAATGLPNYVYTTVARWDADSDAETRAVTCTFAPVISPFQRVASILQGASFPSASLIGFAHVIFGTRGFSTTVDVDIGSGCQFAVNASSVILQVALQRASAAFAQVTADYVGMLSFESPAPPTAHTITIPAWSVTDNGSIFPVPNFARTIFAVRKTLARSLKIVVADYTGAEIFEHTIAANSEMTSAIPLPCDAFNVTLTTDTGQTDVARLIFGLDI